MTESHEGPRQPEDPTTPTDLQASPAAEQGRGSEHPTLPLPEASAPRHEAPAHPAAAPQPTSTVGVTRRAPLHPPPVRPVRTARGEHGPQLRRTRPSPSAAWSRRRAAARAGARTRQAPPVSVVAAPSPSARSSGSGRRRSARPLVGPERLRHSASFSPAAVRPSR